MKKIFYLASIAALAFSSCAKDETAEVTLGVAGSGKIMATAGEADDTRAYLDSNQKFRWQANDGLGVYNDATYPMNNDEYVLTEGAESATGIFVGQKKFDAKHHHVAVYPRLDQNLMPSGVSFTKGKVPSAKNAEDYVPNAITVQIPATQKYQPGSFYSKTVPAVSTTFDVDANGDAAIKMQPVADYLFVNIKSTEPITKLSLKLLKNGHAVNIAGSGNVSAYNLNGNIRYYLSDDVLDSEVIKLETGTYAADLTCHEPNTFVFVVPANVLGADKDIEAFIWVNKDAPAGDSTTGYTFAATDKYNTNFPQHKDNPALSDWTQMNGYWNNNGTSTTQDDVTIIRGEEEDDRKHDPNGVYKTYNMQLENMVFWMNHKDSKGNRTSFTYNPDGAVIIENEGDLLRYLTEYDNTTQGNKYFRKDAYICDNHKFDFSIANITNLSDQLKKAGEYEQYEPYFAAYLAGSFPCVDYYVNEFNGNGAVISDIVMPLASKDGIFGALTSSGSGSSLLQAVIKDVTFKGIVSKSTRMLNAYQTAYVYVPGLILGKKDITDRVLSNVTVEAAEGLAILGNGNVADYKALTVKDADSLDHIIASMNLSDKLAFANWDEVSAVKHTVFGTLDATGHQVVEMPAGADYADLAEYIGTTLLYDSDLNYDADETNDVNTWVSFNELKYRGYPSYSYSPLGAIQNNDDVVSVKIGDVSYWTGDVTTVAPKQVGGNGNDKAYYKIEYAEQLAACANNEMDIRIMRDMNLGEAVNSWAMTTVRKIDGNNKTVTGTYMDVVLNTGSNVTGVAPFDADEIKNLVADGVNIAIKTKGNSTVPAVIGGLALDARVIDGVTVKNLVIAGDGEANNDEQYSTTAPVYIGWLVGAADNISVKGSNVNGVNNSIKGVAGLVGKINVTTGATITSSAATNVTKVQNDLTELVDYSALSGWAGANVAGAQVGYVVNNTNTAKSITLSGAGAPAFVFNVHKPAVLNVIYGTAAYDSVQNYYM